MKKLLPILTLIFFASSLFGVEIKVCVVDACTGELIPNWPITLYDSGPKGPQHYTVDLQTDENGCLITSWAPEGDVSITVANGGSYNVSGNFRAVVQVTPITCINIVENDDSGNPTSTTTPINLDCEDYLLSSNVIRECNNPTMDFCVPEGFDSDDYCYKNEVIDCRTNRIIKSMCGDLDLASLFGGLREGKYTLRTSFGCCDEDEEGGKLECPINPTVRSTTIYWEPSVYLGDVDFDWYAGFNSNGSIEMINNENPSDQGDQKLYSDDHPLPSLGSVTAGVWFDLSQFSGNASQVSWSLRKLDECNTSSGEFIVANGSVPSNINNTIGSIDFNANTGLYFILESNDYVKDKTCFEFCIESRNGTCKVEKCGVFRISDNCVNCLESDESLGSADMIVSEGENQEITFNISPNPVTNYLYLKASDKSMKLTIMDVSGRQIYSGGFVNSIDVSMWNAGFYIARYFDENGNSHVEKFFKY